MCLDDTRASANVFTSSRSCLSRGNVFVVRYDDVTESEVGCEWVWFYNIRITIDSEDDATPHHYFRCVPHF
jgi:hypothetical protein